jgi:hypothetical protein
MAKRATPRVFREAAAIWTEAMQARGFVLGEDARRWLTYARKRGGCWEAVDFQLDSDSTSERVGFLVTCGSILDQVRDFRGEPRTTSPRGAAECSRIMRLLSADRDRWWIDSDAAAGDVVQRAVAAFRVAETWLEAHDAAEKVIPGLVEYLDRRETFFQHLRELSILAKSTGDQRLLARSTARLEEMKTWLFADAVREHLAKLAAWNPVPE